MRVTGGRWAQGVLGTALVIAGSAALNVAVVAAAFTLTSHLSPSPGQATAQTQATAAPGAGTSVWSGVYTDEQAKRGETVSNKLCTSCHGPELSGGEAGPALVGLEFLGNWNKLTVADFYDRVHATMPADAPGTMTPQQTTDVTAYVFKLNKYPAGKTELPTDLASLKAIRIEGEQPGK